MCICQPLPLLLSVRTPTDKFLWLLPLNTSSLLFGKRNLADSLTNFLGKFQHQNVKVLLFAVTTFRHNHIMGKLEDVTFVIKNICLSEGSLHENVMFMTPG